MEEVELQPGPHRPVHRVGDTVRRRPGWWTDAVHHLLRHLEEVGFDLSPRPLGFDEQGREVLTYLEGDSGRTTWPLIVDDAGLAAFGIALRRYHDAVASYRPPAGARWAYGQLPLGDGQIICHGDFGPWNLVWRDGRPVGILDWDLAYPGPAMDDVAYAVIYSAPIRDDEHAMAWQGFSEPPDRTHRIRVFADGYGIPAAGLADAAIARFRLTPQHSRILKAQGLVAPWTTTESIEQDDRRTEWAEANRHLFT